jgi:undecaprenyl diphosphate synthase
MADPTDLAHIPRHVAIIMDGNGRWAESRSLPRIRGHEEGVHSVRSVTRACRRMGVKVLTLYSFSTENWSRPSAEVEGLMSLLVRYLQEERNEILGNGIRLTASGEIDRLPLAVRSALKLMMKLSSRADDMVLNLALSYGSRQEIVRAVQALAREVKRRELKPDAIGEADIERHLYTAGLPDPDLVIRSSGEMRLSNFLLWQVAYSELFVTDVLWPDFREEHLFEAFRAYGNRQRRFGKTGAQLRKDVP